MKSRHIGLALVASGVLALGVTAEARAAYLAQVAILDEAAIPDPERRALCLRGVSGSE